MKRLLLLSLLAVADYIPAVAQQPNVGCLDKAILLRAQEVKNGLEKQNMSVYRDAMIGMESESAFPIEVKLEKAHTYQMLFVGNADAARTTLELFDGDDKQLEEKHIGKGTSPGYILMAFTPVNTDTYLIMLTQRLKKANSCGSFTILEQGGKNSSAGSASPQQKTGTGNYPNTNVNTNTNQKPNSNRYIGPATPAKKH